MKMKMSRIALWSLAFLLVFGINIALAKDQPEGTPFKAIWDAIANLQNQIDNLSGQPGPQGPQGEPGQDGQDGTDGLSCWDLNGNGVGDTEEDVNQDGNYNTLDCKGSQGEQGIQGEPGQDAQYGAGNIAFIFYEYLLKNDGTVWSANSSGNNFWFERELGDVPPVPVANIVSWQRYHLLDKNGNYWRVVNGVWQNYGPLP